MGLLEGKERLRCLDCLNSCSESAAPFPQSSLAAQQPPLCQGKQSNPKKCNLPQSSRITLQDRNSLQLESRKRCFQMRPNKNCKDLFQEQREKRRKNREENIEKERTKFGFAVNRASWANHNDSSFWLWQDEMCCSCCHL